MATKARQSRLSDRCLFGGCAARVPEGPGGLYRRARAAGWARRYTSSLGPDGFFCPDHRAAGGAQRGDVDQATVDLLLVKLSDAPGVDRTSITTMSAPRRGGHGSHAVRWLQDGAKRSTEGNSLETALRRAVAQSGGESATPSDEGGT